jgi:hypothetical protein
VWADTRLSGQERPEESDGAVALGHVVRKDCTRKRKYRGNVVRNVKEVLKIRSIDELSDPAVLDGTTVSDA